MPNIFSLHKIKSLASLIRLHVPVGYLLCFFPACYGLVLGAESRSDLYYILLFFIWGLFPRSAGCIINDLCDRKLDKGVDRTKTRPLASGALKVLDAVIALFILLLCGLLVLLTLTKTAIYLGFVTVILIAIYPLMKRVTYYPQIFLGFAFNMGCLIGYATLRDSLSFEAIVLYLGCACWTVAFDAVYAFMDIKDDKKVGVKSIALVLESMPYKIIITGLYYLFYAVFIWVFTQKINLLGSILIICCMLMTTISMIGLDIKQRSNCLQHFQMNSVVGFVLLIAILLEKL